MIVMLPSLYQQTEQPVPLSPSGPLPLPPSPSHTSTGEQVAQQPSSGDNSPLGSFPGWRGGEGREPPTASVEPIPNPPRQSDPNFEAANAQFIDQMNWKIQALSRQVEADHSIQERLNHEYQLTKAQLKALQQQHDSVQQELEHRSTALAALQNHLNLSRAGSGGMAQLDEIELLKRCGVWGCRGA